MTHRFRLRSALTTMCVVVVFGVAFSTPLMAAEGAAAAESWAPTIARIINFAILAGGLYYMLGRTVSDYLRTRSETIRKHLVDAKTLRSEAEGQLAGVRTRLAALPDELRELTARGDEELAAEKIRLANATASERTRVQEQTRREIELTSRLARRDLMLHGVDLSMKLARARIERDITAEDQTRLVDGYQIAGYTPGVRQ